MPHPKQTLGVHVVEIIVKLIVCALVLAPVLSLGQTGTAGIIRERPRSSYDPGYRQNAQAQQQSGISAALQKINRTDKDYGQLIDEARISVIEQTVEDFYWWSCLVLTALLILALSYIIWLWRERELRLNISADIVAQLYNSHVASRAKALEVIEMHNKLARRYNARCTELAGLRAEMEQKASKEINVDATVNFRERKSSVTSDGRSPECDAEMPDSYDAGSEVPLPEKLDELEQLRLRNKQLEAQSAADKQKVNNLRTQLNRAHTTIQQERERGKPGAQRDDQPVVS